MARKTNQTQYKKWLEEDSLLLLRGWAREGLIDEQIAKNIGIATSTLYEWKKKYSDFAESLKKGKEVADFEVENALYKSAIDGNVTAQIFWLKNRKPSKWRDKPEETTENIATTINLHLENIAELLKKPVAMRKISEDDA